MTTDVQPVRNTISYIEPELFDLDNNTRDDTSDYRELLGSISRFGILEPVLARPKSEGRFGLVAGRSRVQAAREAGLLVVPTIVREMDDDEALEIEIAENLNRKNLTPVEEARALVKLLAMRLRGMPEFERLVPKDMANTPENRVGTLMYRLRRAAPRKDLEAEMVESSAAARTVVNTLREYQREWRHFADTSLPLLNYPKAVQDFVQAGGSLRAARELSKVKDPELLQKSVERTQQLSERQGEVQASRTAVREVLGEARMTKGANAQQARNDATYGNDRRTAVPEAEGEPKDPYHYPQGTISVLDAYPDLHRPLWGQEDGLRTMSEDGELVDGVALRQYPVEHEGEVPLEVYGRLLAGYTVPGERVLSVDSPTSPLIEYGTDLGRLVYATCPDAGRVGIVAASPVELPEEVGEPDLVVVHLPAWNEVPRAANLGWDARATAADLSSLEDYEAFMAGAMQVVAEARRVGKMVAVVCRDFSRHGIQRPVNAIMQVNFGTRLVNVHSFIGWNGLLWNVIVGKGTR